jgi:hypothetical protein
MEYKDAKSMEEVDVKYHGIRAWWLSLGATTKDGHVKLIGVMGFWHCQYRQWGGHMLIVSVLNTLFFQLFHYIFLNLGLAKSPYICFPSYTIGTLERRVEMPICNLVETLHNKWLQLLGHIINNMPIRGNSE